MNLSEYGRIVYEEWEKSFIIRKELFCEAFIIMPNHIHAILRIENKKNDISDSHDRVVETHGCASDDQISNNIDVETHGCASDDQTNNNNIDVETHGCVSDDQTNNNNIDVETHDLNVETHGRASLRVVMVEKDGKISGIPYREPKSISSFVGCFKSAVTIRINLLKQTKGFSVWQTRFHDHVIRDNEEYRRIANYIDSNVEHWEDDMFYIP
jgi:REP element-mobilizing transposase RayT